MICIHHNDNDGRLSAAIVKHAHPNDMIRFREVDYGVDIAPVIASATKNDTVIIVDFSLAQEDFDKLRQRAKRIIWIDHHKSAAGFAYARPDNPMRVAGERDFRDKGWAACELTWRHFFGGARTPPLVSLVGDYDAGRRQHAPECHFCHEGLKIQPFSSDPKHRDWAVFLSDRHPDHIITEGKLLCKYRDVHCAGLRDHYGYDAEIEGWGKYTCFALNILGFGSCAFGDAAGRYQVLASYINGGDVVKCVLYAGSPDVDVAEICKSFGGGGHKGAAGFVWPADKPFPIKIKNPPKKLDLSR